MTHPTDPQAVLFDLDGTLIDSEPRSQAAWQTLFDRYGIALDPRVRRGFSGRPGRNVLREHLASFPAIGLEELFAEVLVIQSGPDVPGAEPVPGAVAFIRRLHRAGVPLGVVTSGRRDYAHCELAALGVAQFLDVVVTSDDVSRGKPDPEGYLTGCAGLGSEPARTIVFEDTPAGITAARSAGARCVGIATGHAPAELGQADMVVPDFTGLRWPLRLPVAAGVAGVAGATGAHDAHGAVS